MKVSANKYLILAIAGAILIAAGLYIMLDNYFEKVEIIVAGRALPEDKVIEPEDIRKMQYFKNSLPQGYITDENAVIGRVLTVPRQPMDPVTETAFTVNTGQDMAVILKETEVLLALNLGPGEPISKKLLIGSKISIVSSQKDEDLKVYSNKGEGVLMEIVEGSYVESSVFKLSKNIIAIDGQIIIKNLEIVNIESTQNTTARSFTESEDKVSSIFIKCDIKEAPFISRVTRDNDYKIVMEKS